MKSINKNKYHIYDEVSEQLNEDRKLVSTIGDFVFNELKDAMYNFTDYKIYMSKLGTFKIRAGQSEKYIKSIQNYIDNIDKKLKRVPENKEETISSLEERISKVRKTLDDYYDQIDQRNTFKTKRKEELDNE